MKTVYVLSCSDHGENMTYGVFSSKQKAEKYLNELLESMFVHSDQEVSKDNYVIDQVDFDPVYVY